MWKGKRKYIIIGLLGVVVVAGSIAGVAFAQTGGSGATDNRTTLMSRVAAILGIDQTKLENAFTQAQKEQQDQRLTDYLNGLVQQGKITQQQADQYKQWYQSRPNVPLPGGKQPFGMHSPGRGMMGGRYFNRGVPAPNNPAPTQPQ